MACTLTAVPQDSGISFNSRYTSARSLFQLSNTANTEPQSCSQGSVGKSRPNTGADQRFETVYQFAQVVGIEIGVELYAFFLFYHVDDHFKGVVVFFGDGFEAHDHVAVHLYKTAVGVPSEAVVARFDAPALLRLRR
jgi:hypothetical protein